MNDAASKIRIAMLLDNDFESDTRVLMEATTLASTYDLTLYCMKASHLPDAEIINNIKIRRVFLSEGIYKYSNKKNFKTFAEQILKENFKVLHCHDHLMLEMGVLVKKMNNKIKLIYDSHELFHSWPLHPSNGGLINSLKSYVVRWLRIKEEKRNSRNLDGLVTVNDSLARILKKYFHLPFEPVVLKNFRVYESLKTGENILRKKFNIPASKRILVFIGMKIFPEVLNLETIIDQFKNDEKICIVFICKIDSNQKYFEDYVISRNIKNVFFHPIIAQSDILKHLSDCDAGLVPTWNKKDLSYWYALDNKLFNYVSAGIPVLSTAQPEYVSIVENYNIGVCVNPDHSSTAYHDGMEKIIANYDTYKENILKAREVLKWENESKKLLDLYCSLIG